MIQSETKEKTIECHPLNESWKMGEGYYYSITITTKYEDDVEETERTEWFIHPNGTFSTEAHITPNCINDPVLYYGGGTFEESRYNDYVGQMKEFKEDWVNELVYDEKQSGEYPPYKRTILWIGIPKSEEFSNEKTEEEGD